MAKITYGSVKETRTIAVVRKAEANEIRVCAITMDVAPNKIGSFLDLRVYWIKTRDVEEIPTRKGVSIPRESVPALLLAVLKELKASEISDTVLMELREEVERIAKGDGRDYQAP